MGKKRMGICYDAECKRVFFYNMNKIYMENFSKGTNNMSIQEFINKYKENYQLKPYWTDNRYISINEKSLKDNIKPCRETYILLNFSKHKSFFIGLYEAGVRSHYDEYLYFL